jgi:hypothetical protein
LSPTVKLLRHILVVSPSSVHPRDYLTKHSYFSQTLQASAVAYRAGKMLRCNHDEGAKIEDVRLALSAVSDCFDDYTTE